MRINSKRLRLITLAAFDDIEYVSDFFVDDGAIDFVGLDEVSDGGNVSTFVVHSEIDLQEKRLALESGDSRRSKSSKTYCV